MTSCQELLDLYTSDKEKFCCRLVTEDETWIHPLGPRKHIRIYTVVEARRLPTSKEI